MRNKTFSGKKIFELCFYILKQRPLYHVTNAFIWLSISIFPILLGLLIKNVFNRLENQKSLEFGINIGILFVLTLTNIFLTYKGGIVDTKSRFYTGKFLRENLFTYFIENHSNYSVPTIINMFNTDIEIIEEFISFMMDFINKIIFFICAFVILMSINYKMTIYISITLILMSLFIYFSGDKIKKYYFKAKEIDVDSMAMISSIIESHEFIRIHGAVPGIIEKIEKMYKEREYKNIKKCSFLERLKY